jgi:hypothetical protein
MTILDDRGRLFGRINLVDAAVGAFVILLIPAAYITWLLFRPLPVRVSKVEPAVVESAAPVRLRISGEDFRPFMRAYLNDVQLHTFAVESPISANAEVPPLPPGKYDLSLFTEMQRLLVVPGAVTVVARPSVSGVTLRLFGSFHDIKADRTAALVAGARLPASGDPQAEILIADPPRPDTRRVRLGQTIVAARGAALEVPAVVRAHCEQPAGTAPNCKVGDVVLAPGVDLPFSGWGIFTVEEIRGDTGVRPVTIDVRFVARPGAAALMRVGDGDVTVVRGPDRPALTGLGTPETVTGVVTDPFGGTATLQSSERMTAISGTVRLMADETPVGLQFRGQPLRAGAPFWFETATYAVQGTITRVTQTHE